MYGLDNPFKSEREESFYTLSLEVKHKRSILVSPQPQSDEHNGGSRN